METMTTTKTTTNTKMAVATLAMLGAGAAALATLPLSPAATSPINPRHYIRAFTETTKNISAEFIKSDPKKQALPVNNINQGTVLSFRIDSNRRSGDDIAIQPLVSPVGAPRYGFYVIDYGMTSTTPKQPNIEPIARQVSWGTNYRFKWTAPTRPGDYFVDIIAFTGTIVNQKTQQIRMDDYAIIRLKLYQLIPITIYSPRANDFWLINNSYDIVWTGGSLISPITIELRNAANTQTIATIAGSISNASPYHWQVPSTVIPNNYLVRVRCPDCTALISGFGDSPLFTIVAAPAAVGSSGNNSSLSVQRLFPGQFNNTKYKLIIGDPDGIKYAFINGIPSEPLYDFQLISTPPSCITSLDSGRGALTMLPSDFPITGYVIDCKDPLKSYAISADMPPL